MHPSVHLCCWGGLVLVVVRDVVCVFWDGEGEAGGWALPGGLWL